MPAFVNVSGTWHSIAQGGSAPSVRVGGVWHPVSNGYVKVAGVWRRFYFSDNVGPGTPPIIKAGFTHGQGYIIFLAPADTDYNHMHVECYLDGTSPGNGSPVVSTDIIGAPGSIAQVNNTVDNPFFKIQWWYTTPFDTNGNAGTTMVTGTCSDSGAPRGRIPSPTVFTPDSYRTWRSVGGAWNTSLIDMGVVNPGPVGYDGTNDWMTAAFFDNQLPQLRGADIYSIIIRTVVVSVGESATNARNVGISTANFDPSSMVPTFSTAPYTITNGSASVTENISVSLSNKVVDDDTISELIDAVDHATVAPGQFQIIYHNTPAATTRPLNSLGHRNDLVNLDTTSATAPTGVLTINHGG